LNFGNVQDPTRGEGTSYAPERPSYPYEVPVTYDIDERPTFNTGSDWPTYNTNDWPTYNHERASHPSYDSSTTEETDRAIALALEEEENYSECSQSDPQLQWIFINVFLC